MEENNLVTTEEMEDLKDEIQEVASNSTSGNGKTALIVLAVGGAVAAGVALWNRHKRKKKETEEILECEVVQEDEYQETTDVVTEEESEKTKK